MQCLSIFPNSSLENQKQLAETALLASLFRADITRLTLREESDMMESDLASDCSGLIDAAHDSLSQSIVILHNLVTTGQGHESFSQRLREIQDWLTAAHYSNSYCLNEFTSDNNMNNSTELVRGRVLYQYQTTENAIDLFRRFAKSLGVRF
ncbi:pectinesterase inhibitor 9-like [Mercurialis annua]|uniref:pectinesterase inhibitor 9-like n=1 Tax=Mercurialis annua TaxID=3986 RepID=UPI002160E655|nr:pectinesterase inhibitor 9-like [Mercurialis annua]